MTVLAAAVAFAVVPGTAMAKSDVRLFIDPGHGGKDPGAVSGNLYEKDVALSVGKLVAESAERQGWDVKMSRDKDVFVPLKERPARAAKWGATTYVSIHSNSTGDKKLGNMTIYRSKEGRRLGKAIMGEMDKLTDYDDIGNRKDERGLAVLRGAEMPAVLVEVLAVTPKEERRRLKDPAFHKKAAESIVKGVAKYEGVEYIGPDEPKEEPKPEPKPKPAPEPVKVEVETEPAAEPQTEAPAETTSVTKVVEAPSAEADPVAADAPADLEPETDTSNSSGWLGSLWRMLTR